MVLIYIQKQTPRMTYAFKQMIGRILGLKVNLTSKIEEFIAFKGAKFSYGEKRMGNEVFVKAYGLLQEQGIERKTIEVKYWGEIPVFFYVGQESDVPFDIFSAAFYLLSRYEEYLPYNRDQYGRYPAEESLAYSNKFLRMPVIDLWAYRFQAILKREFPLQEFPERKFQAKNIMTVAEVFKYKEKGLVRNIGGGLRDLLRFRFKTVFNRIKTQLSLNRDPYDVYEEILRFSRQNGFSWEFMFQLSDYSSHCNNIGHNNLKYHSMIKSMGDYGPIGLLLGYDAIYDKGILRKEKKRWEEIVNRDLEVALSPMYGINLPELYNNYDDLEIAHDYSMGYPDKVGFRAGTCTPFLYYDLSLERISPLLIHPIAFNSITFARGSFFEIRTVLDRLRKQVKAVNGELLMIYRNSDFKEGASREKFFQILERMNNEED